MAGERMKSVNVPLPIVEPATNPSLQPSPQIAPTANPRMRVVAPSASAVAVNPMAAAPAAPVVGPDNRVPMPSSAEIAAAAAKAYQPTDNKLAAFAQGFANAQAVQNKSQREVDAENRKLEEAERLKAKQIDFLRNTDPEMAAAVEAGVLDPQTAYTTSRSAKAGKYRIEKAGGKIIRINENTGETEVLGDFGEPNEYDTRRAEAAKLGMDENDPRFSNYVLTGKMSGSDKPQMTATEQKALWASEDEIPVLDGTIDSLQRAKDLNDKTYTGKGADWAGWAGAKVPGGDYIFDEEKAKNTVEFGNLMSMEAIQNMANTLKGATTDKELGNFVTLLADPSTPPDIRGRTIDRMLTLAQRQRQVKQSRINELRGEDSPGKRAGYRDPTVSQSNGADAIQQARYAIANGADPEKVKERLGSMGIDAGGL